MLKEKELKQKPRDALFDQHLGLVQRLARYYSHQAVQSHYDDLVQVGCMGLLRAIDRFDESQNASFRTYASHLISSEIRHYLRDHVSIVRLPRDLQELVPKLRQAEQALWQALEREPELGELAAYLDVKEQKLEEVYQMESNYSPLSLNQKAFPGSTSALTVLDQMEEQTKRSFHLTQEDRILLQDAMDKIRSQSRQMIEFAFYHDLTQTEIAKHLGISQMQVSRRLKKAVTELWDTLNTRVTPW